MSTIFSTIGQPRGRGKQERFFQTVNQLFLSELPGYLTSGARNPTPTLTLEDLDKAFCNWLLDEYMQRVHSELGVTPGAKWESVGFIPRLPDSIEQLDLLLLTVSKTQVKLIIIDECNRLKIPAMEQVRDLYDQLGIPVVLIGLPGFEKYVGRFPQLSSRIGFYHEFQPLAADELMEILETELLNEFEFGFTNQVFDSRESMSSLVRVTGGNLRTLSRLCLQMKRVMTVNNLELINEEVIQTARRAIVATIR